MFTELYIEALLADEVLADQVWELWHAGIITNDEAEGFWLRLAGRFHRPRVCRHSEYHRCPVVTLERKSDAWIRQMTRFRFLLYLQLNPVSIR